MSHQHQMQQQQMQDHHMSHGAMMLPMSVTQMTTGVGGSMRTEQHGNQIVHVRGDSDSDLEALFSVLHNIDGRQTSSSFKNRKLPASFFRPPDPKAAASAGGVGNSLTGAAVAVAGGLTNHGRSVSSPAQLHHGGGSSSQGSHGKSSAGSAGVAAADSFLDELAAGVPSGWEISKNCPRYYLNPGVGIWQQEMQAQHGSMSGHSAAVYGQVQGRGAATGSTPTTGGGMQPHQHTSTAAPSGEFLHQDPLPHGWEQGITPEGEIYFINHVDKTTSWYDPRLPRHRQSAAPARVGPHPMIVHPHSQHQHQQQQQQQQQQPQQTQQQIHLSPKQQQTQCQMHVPHQQMSNSQHVGGGAGAGGGGGARSAHSEHFICLELQKLHKEKERLQQEQEAISCREMMLNELVRQTSATSPCDTQMKCAGGGGVVAQQPEGALAMIQTMQSLYGSTMTSDVFVSPCGGGVESHARQNSTDSGLGGMGTTYSLPRSPDDYLSNVDEIDMQEDVSPVQKLNNPCFMNMAGGSDLIHLRHLTSVGDMMDDTGVMDGEQLFSQLAGDVTSELLSDMDVQKIDSILYMT